MELGRSYFQHYTQLGTEAAYRDLYLMATEMINEKKGARIRLIVAISERFWRNVTLGNTDDHAELEKFALDLEKLENIVVSA